MHPCSTFPGKYSFLSKSGWITESVCMVTQSPPKLNIPQLSTKRSPSSAIRPRFIQPLVSSVKPQISTCIQPWNLHKNHLSAKLITTRKIIIQAQILAMERIALSISLTAPSLSEEEPIRKLPPPPGRRAPVITVPKIQTSQIFHPIPDSAKLGPNSPKIKAAKKRLTKKILKMGRRIKKTKEIKNKTDRIKKRKILSKKRLRKAIRLMLQHWKIM